MPAAFCAGLILLAGPAPARGAPVQEPRRAPRAPRAPVLGTGGAIAPTGSARGGEVEGDRVTPAGETDPLVSNGLGSPLCKGALGGALPAASRRDCETSGFAAAPAPTGDYGIDVHIDTGLLGVTTTSAVQDLFVTPLWTALVWAMHALIVMLEWCYAIDVLDSSWNSLGRGLRQMQSSLTAPWLALVLAVAAVLAAYNGLVRRRVAQTLGETALALAMMAGGMWVIVDPAGTVGAVAGMANQSSLGTLAVAARGNPAGGGGALGESMAMVFAALVEAPWCYLEFGNVDWCRDPGRLDARLRAAGLKIAADEQSQAASAAPAPARALARSALLLREANTNGALFLALPPNGPARNSINDEGSLLRTLCGSDEATACRGPTAAQAQFRTGGGTWARVGGLLLIVAGTLGVLLLLGFLALRLLAAALFSLLYLLLAPAAVLAPALGESGRAVFRRWVTRLLGAVFAKLLFSFALGVVLAVVAILEHLDGLGWWTRWLLGSAFWWGAYTHRHQALGLLEGRGAAGQDRTRVRVPRPLGRRVRDALAVPRGAAAIARRTKALVARPAPSLEQSRRLELAGRVRAGELSDAQAQRGLEHEHAAAGALAEQGPETQARLGTLRSRLARLQGAREDARRAGDSRRHVRLAGRERGLADQIAREEDTLRRARHAAAEGERARRRTGQTHTPEQRERYARLLDAQAALPSAGRPNAQGERRDYAALAGLAGHGREDYERLDPRRQREARVQIDRELAERRELRGAAAGIAQRDQISALSGRERRTAERSLDGVVREGMRAQGRRRPDSARGDRAAGRGPLGGSSLEEWKRVSATAGRVRGDRDPHPPRTGSPVLEDARAVAEGRKRQLGPDLP